MTRSFERRIGDKTISVELDIDQLKIGNGLAKAADTVASTIGLVGELTSETVRKLGEADSHYRHWRSKRITGILDHDPKLAEWKARARVEAEEEFLRYKSILARYESDLEYLRAYHAALRTKSSMIRAKVSLKTSE